MQYVGHRITFLRTLKVGCILCLAASSVALAAPQDAQALNLSQTLKQLAKVKNSLTPKTNKANTQSNTHSPKKQAASTNTTTVAYEPQTTTTEPQATPEPAPTTIIPQTPPVPAALPPEVEPVPHISNIPSRQQLVGLLARPLLATGTLTYRSFVAYPDTDSFAVVRPSPEGWKIFGIPWMWWVIGSGLVWLGNRLLIRHA